MSMIKEGGRTHEIDAVVAVAEPSGRPLVREVNAVVREVCLGVISRQVVVVADVRRGVAEDVNRGNLRLGGDDDSKEEEKKKDRPHRRCSNYWPLYFAQGGEGGLSLLCGGEVFIEKRQEEPLIMGAYFVFLHDGQMPV